MTKDGKVTHFVEWCKSPDVGLPKPDAVIFLDLPIEKAMERGAFGEERYEKEDFQKKVYKNFQKLNDGWHCLNADRTVDEVADEVEQIALNTIKNLKDNRIEKLWMTKSN